MYEIVKTSRQQIQFQHSWEYFCEKYNWENDPYAKDGIRYNLLLPEKKKKVIGTIEFIPYDPQNPDSTVEGRFPFSTFEDIRINQKRVWEIDKLCLNKEFHRQGFFEDFMHVFYDHATSHYPKYYVALMEKKFYRMMRISFGLGVDQRGEAMVGPSGALIPIVFDIEKIMQDEEVVKKLLAMSSSGKKREVNQSLSMKNLVSKIVHKMKLNI
ncbi:hypothetical protein MHI18_01325 [Peribacillus sp. FSL H8-0477]|uniref:hypothetical protein n=1 Tax=Peribacillus sp. FSL H8-0477 TaxID=2921388 RepID=UPI0030FCFA6A